MGDTTHELVERRVVDMFEQCAYQIQMRPGATAMSDCCREPATTAVVLRPDGTKGWRCPTHKGLVKNDEVGEVLESVMARPPGQ